MGCKYREFVQSLRFKVKGCVVLNNAQDLRKTGKNVQTSKKKAGKSNNNHVAGNKKHLYITINANTLTKNKNPKVLFQLS